MYDFVTITYFILQSIELKKFKQIRCTKTLLFLSFTLTTNYNDLSGKCVYFSLLTGIFGLYITSSKVRRHQVGKSSTRSACYFFKLVAPEIFTGVYECSIICFQLAAYSIACSFVKICSKDLCEKCLGNAFIVQQ